MSGRHEQLPAIRRITIGVNDNGRRQEWMDVNKDHRRGTTRDGDFSAVLGDAKTMTYTKNIPREIMIRYGRSVGPKLKALMEKAAEARQGFDVSTELALIQVAAGQAVETYSSLMERETNDKFTLEIKEQCLQATANVVMQQQETVIRSFQRAAEMSKYEQVITPAQIHGVVQQIMRWYQFTLGKEYPEACKLLDEYLTNELELPSIADKGTTITADQQVRAMIDTVPYCEEATNIEEVTL